MRALWLRWLMLACGVFLTLPPGWCCIFALAPARIETAGEAPCPSCCGHKTPVPAPEPAPEKPDRCPCDDRLSITPDIFKVFPGDLLLVSAPTVLDLLCGAAGSRDSLDLSSPDIPFSPHLLNCVWLC